MTIEEVNTLAKQNNIAISELGVLLGFSGNYLFNKAPSEEIKPILLPEIKKAIDFVKHQRKERAAFIENARIQRGYIELDGKTENMYKKLMCDIERYTIINQDIYG